MFTNLLLAHHSTAQFLNLNLYLRWIVSQYFFSGGLIDHYGRKNLMHLIVVISSYVDLEPFQVLRGEPRPLRIRWDVHVIPPI